MFIKPLLLLLSFCMSSWMLVQVVWSQTGEIIFVQKKQSANWEKVFLEDNIRKRLTTMIKPLFADSEYAVDVYITLDKSKTTVQEDDYVPLAKLEMEAPILGEEVVVKDIFKRVEKVNMVVVVNRPFPPEQQSNIQQIAESLITFVPSYKIHLKVIDAKPSNWVSRLNKQIDNLELDWRWVLAGFFFVLTFYVAFKLYRVFSELSKIPSPPRRPEKDETDAA